MSNFDIPRLVLIASASPLSDVYLAYKQVQATNGKILELDILPTHEIQDGIITPRQVLNTVSAAKAVMFDLRGTPDKVLGCLQQALIATQAQDIAFIPVFGGGPSVMALTRMKEFAFANLPGTDYRRIKQFGDDVTSVQQKMSPQKLYHSQNLAKCVSYWTNAGVENLANLLRFVACEYAGVEVTAGEPIVYPDAGFIDIATGQRYQSYTDYITAHPLNPDLPSVAVLFYGGTSMGANLVGGEEFFTELAKKANVLPFFADGIKTTEAIATHFFHNDQPICDAIASLLWFRLDGGLWAEMPRKLLIY